MTKDRLSDQILEIKRNLISYPLLLEHHRKTRKMLRELLDLEIPPEAVPMINNYLWELNAIIEQAKKPKEELLKIWDKVKNLPDPLGIISN